jgi:hypothetical protein
MADTEPEMDGKVSMRINRAMSRRKIKQINNILIYWYPVSREFYAISPDGYLLECFKTQAAAENWCKECGDFTAKGMEKHKAQFSRAVQRIQEGA